MERSGMAFVPRSNSSLTHKAVTLDLMLRTFMNSPDFQPNNPKMWEGIARLVPGTTAQQCLQRWEELRSSTRMISRDLSCISAQGKLLSPQHEPTLPLPAGGPGTTLRKLTSSSSLQFKQPLGFAPAPELPPIFPSTTRPSTAREPYTYDHQYRGSVSSGQSYRAHSGQFTAAFCQSHIYNNDGTGKKEMECEEDNDEGGRTSEMEEELEVLSKTPSFNTMVSASVSSPSSINGGRSSSLQIHEQNCVNSQRSVLLIHVKDEAKKVNKDFSCPRDVLVKEMKYFDEYLSTPNHTQWEEVDISVHCDVAVFNWLMKYAKRGLMEGPSGEQLQAPLEPDQLDSFNVVSILISSDFLKMDKLVEKCIKYCCENLSDVISTPCNMHCIGNHLLTRIAKEFTPLELEKVEDPKDKVKNKLFVYKLETMFSTESPPSVNGLTLFKCKHCGCLLTQEQQLVFPCASYRLKVNRSGTLVYQHEGDTSWDINKHLNGLRKKGMTWREIYWRLWGVINWFTCTVCNEPFQCQRMDTCVYHPGTLVISDTGQYYSCCNRSVDTFTPLLSNKNGCHLKAHTLADSLTDGRRVVDEVLSKVRDLVMEKDKRMGTEASGGNEKLMTSLMENEEKQLQNKLKDFVYIKKRSSTAHTVKKVQQDSIANDETKPGSTKAMKKLKKQVKVNKRALEDEDSSSSDSESGDGDSSDSETTSSEMEEEDKPNKEAAAATVRAATQKQKVLKQAMSTSNKKKSMVSKKSIKNLADWEWDSSKSTRWNQDMQRHEDDRRMANIRQNLQQLSVAGDSKSIKTTSSNKLGNEQPSFKGGIFCRIETQFRAQRIVANGIPIKQSGHRSFRKANYSKSGLN